MNAKNFNPDEPGIDNGNYFGMPFTPDEAALTLLSVPWDVTSSYGAGAAKAPEAIIKASTQLDFFDPVSPMAWKKGIATLPIDREIEKQSNKHRKIAATVMRGLEKGYPADPAKLQTVNAASERIYNKVYELAKQQLDKGKIVGLVGGDHSTPLGLIRALYEHYGEPCSIPRGHELSCEVSILHIDAHADLRQAYEGFTHSHASIMHNALPFIDKLVQVGVRDQSHAEAVMEAIDHRIVQFGDWELATAEFEGGTWASQCDKIVAELGARVYISFDIDGLAPELAPGTGTPVPGGLTFNKAVWLMDAVVRSGRKIVGFDLCEVSPAAGEWDANVGARVLFKLCGLALR